MQAKDVPEGAILHFLAGPFDGWPAPGWATWFWSDDYRPANSVLRAMPEGTPPKVALAKMRSLIRRGLVTGCGCGCRGDFELTDKGRALVSGAPPTLISDRVVYYCDGQMQPRQPAPQ